MNDMQSTQEVSILRQAQVVKHHFVLGAVFAETHTEPRGERSIEEIAQGMLMELTSYAFHIEEVIKATVNVEGRSVQLVSQPTSFPLTYVGGTISTVDEVRTHHPEKTNFIEYLEQFGPHARAIHTRTGQWVLFRDEDQLLEPVDDGTFIYKETMQ